MAIVFSKSFVKLIILGHLIIVPILSGCMSANTFTADSLPPDLCWTIPPGAQTIDLSAVSRPSSSGNLISAGDVLGINLAAGLSDEDIVKLDVRVGNDGMVSLPDIGHIQLAGLDTTAAENTIAVACVNRGLYRDPRVGVTLKQREMNRITVVGAVKEPGVIELPHGSSHVLAAIMAAGGLEKDAGTNVEIRRPGYVSGLAGRGTNPQTSGVTQVSHTESAGLEMVEPIRINLAEASGESIEQTELCDGCVINVERLTLAPIEVIGLVRKPGQFEYPVTHELRLLGAIALAGGVSSKHTKKVLVVRRHPYGSGAVVIKANIDKAKHCPEENLCLVPGDVVSVEETLGTMIADILSFARFGIGASIPMF